jgi:crotonobetainyl-CoA:carnitine CoA-transferase CaiB-like acyl-CoA transferase
VTARPGALAPYRVLDLTGALGPLAGKMLADLGADVVRVEPPEGSALRRLPPFADGVAAPEGSLAWWAYAAGTRSVALDLASTDGRAQFLSLVRAADFLLESLPPGTLERWGLGWPALHRENRRLIVASISPFGQAGPHRDWRGPELVTQAMGGMVYAVGDPDRPPVRVGGSQASCQAAGQAVLGALVAHFEREQTGEGRWVDVSAQHAVVNSLLSATALPALHGFTPTREGSAVRTSGFRRRILFRAKDGFVALTVGGGVLSGAMMTALVKWMAEEGQAPDFMRERDWVKWDNAYLLAAGARGQEDIDRVSEAVAAFAAARTKGQLYEAALERGLLIAPVADMADLVEDRQLAARGFFAPVAEPRARRTVRMPGAWARLSLTPLRAPAPAPRMGEHTAEVLSEWREPRARPPAPEAPRAPGARRPFEGLRVVDFAWVATGPLTGRLLAEYGADVIRLESARRLDPGRTLTPWAEGKSGPNRSQGFANYNAGKRSMALDLAKPEARDLARRLIATADVVVESFSAGTTARWGLDWATLSREHPGLIYLSSCQQGQTGPHAHYRGYGSLAAALAGFYSVTGWPDREPAMIYGAYTDFVAHHFASAAVLAALDHRRRTGQGQHIDLSQLESSLHFLAPEILEYTVNGRLARSGGNADPLMAPHAIYPCRAADGERWCAVACEDDAQWHALVEAMGKPEWALDRRLATAAGRKAQETMLDARLAEWTASQSASALAERLQAAGIAAGVAQSCADLHGDAGLAARRAFAWVEHPEMGRTPYETWAFRMGEDAAPRRAPLLGEHTHEVLTQVLRLSPDEIARLVAAGVFV